MEDIKDLLIGYKNKGVLVDSNLLLVYVVGMYDPSRIARFKRTATFSIDDFYLLAQLLRFFQKVVTTPNILTEVNSFSNQLPEDIKPSYNPEFAKQITLLEEHYLASNRVSSVISFQRFGLTDSGIAELARGKYVVLSDDLKLVIYLQKEGIDAVNFNHIRYLTWNN